MTDNRYCNLHMSDDAVRMLEFRTEDEEMGFGVMPGWDEVIEIPPEHEPPRLENDEILPTKIHPSYPHGRPELLSHPPTASFGQISLSKASGRAAPEVQRLLDRLGLAPNALRNTKTIWSEWGLRSNTGGQTGIFVGVVEEETREEIAPGMAGAQRPPTPPSPQIRRPKRTRSPSTASTTSRASAYPDSPPPTRATAQDQTSESTPPSSPGADSASMSGMTEPLNDEPAEVESGSRTGAGERRRWTRRRRNTGTRGNPLDRFDGAGTGDVM
ncbi:hypothetical protein NliqN6_4466 [Naganishia liquefaciens]|uniref:Uncharacterized protein n=1 Tax=Naganishia liquefaciens TaxID=104408 RepID=A0A8H3TVY2_9TREE|nr:hypothetical protein NliqN6_4466 [Naganishia liquefaciens]